jgi:uncharacterized membrane protein (UPF0127 family)
MSSRLQLSALAVLLACCGLEFAPDRPLPPAATACANPQLPPDILDGPAQRSAGKPLAVVDVRSDEVTLRLAVAADETARELGLMCVTRLRPEAGMIFVFDEDGQEDFWMKNTLVPLDMVWVAADGTVRSIAADVPASTLQTPDDRVARRSGLGRYVLELSAGEAQADGIVKGRRLVIPPFKSP